MASGTPVTYKITKVLADTQYNDQNTPIRGKQVTYEMSTGYVDTIFVPNNVFNDTGALKKLIEGEVRMVAAAHDITGTVG